MIEIQAPAPYPHDQPIVFLAGSIEEDTAPRWQEEVVRALADLPITILNPRRAHWDANLSEQATNPLFREQVLWELGGQEEANLILLHLAEGMKSPISLLELGLNKDRPMLVSCDQGYWREGNVRIVCERYQIPFFETLTEMVQEARRRFSH